jgi:hypothetical protein
MTPERAFREPAVRATARWGVRKRMREKEESRRQDLNLRPSAYKAEFLTA